MFHLLKRCFIIEYEGAWTCQSALDWPLVRRDERYRPFAIERVPRKGLVWKNGVACDHCGNADQDKITKLEGKVRRPHLYQCNASRYREQFTVTVGTGCQGFGANSCPQSSRKSISWCQ